MHNKMRSWKNTTSTSQTCARSFISINDPNIIIIRFQQLFTFIRLSFKSRHLSNLPEVNLYHYMHGIIYHSIAWCWVLIKQNSMLISHESNSCRVTVMQTATASRRPHGGYQRHIKVMLVSALFSSLVQQLIWTLQDKQNNPRLSVTI
jgi:hypothetical protein